MHKILVLDFGGQYSHLIARRIRDLGVLAEVVLPDIKIAEIKNNPKIKGLILSGGAKSVYEKNAPRCAKKIFDLGLPILGICYGHQLIAHLLDGRVKIGKLGEYGLAKLFSKSPSKIFKDFFPRQSASVWMNHRDAVRKLPKGFKIIGSTKEIPIAAFADEKRKIFGLQFHPEVTHTERGDLILSNFLKICGAEKTWKPKNLSQKIIEETKEVIGKNRAIIALSGGVDSSTAAVLVGRAIGKNLLAVYVDSGLMRQNETEFIKKTFKKLPLRLKIVYAKKRFLKSLKGVSAPEKKRKIIGTLFIKILEEVAKKEKAKFLIQGTIYSDRIESGLTRYSAKIKSHHNVGGLPKKLKIQIYEPLRHLYKDEVRKLAKEVGLPKEIFGRQVFPGPGLAIRVIGEVTPKKVEISRKASQIIEEELERAGLYKKLWMSFAVVLPIKSVGIQGDERSYKYPVVVRIIESADAMTANFFHIPYALLEKISTRITNEIKEVNRVVYDITNKPPGTMEWE